jgi:hypothetical protein
MSIEGLPDHGRVESMVLGTKRALEWGVGWLTDKIEPLCPFFNASIPIYIF